MINEKSNFADSFIKPRFWDLNFVTVFWFNFNMENEAILMIFSVTKSLLVNPD